MPSFRALLTAAVLASLAQADTIKVTATSDNTFDPDTVKGGKGDIIEFHFDPHNHSVVAGDYQYPCSPLELGTGFFSGFVDSDSGEADKVFQVTLNDTKPIAFYSSQGNECAEGMVGIINPTGTENLTDYKQRASKLSKGVSPGRASFGGQLVDNNDDSSNKSSSDKGGDKGDGSDDNGDGGNAAGALRIPMLGLLGVIGLVFFMG